LTAVKGRAIRITNIGLSSKALPEIKILLEITFKMDLGFGFSQPLYVLARQTGHPPKMLLQCRGLTTTKVFKKTEPVREGVSSQDLTQGLQVETWLTYYCVSICVQCSVHLYCIFRVSLQLQFGTILTGL